MSGRARAGAAGIVAGILLLALAPAAVAHGGRARLILEQDRVNPGGVLVVRGEDLGADDEVRVGLVGGTTHAELTTVVSDGQGHFTVAVRIPVDVPAGMYAIRAAGQSGVKLAAAVYVEGAPIADAGVGAPPGQDEGLPAIAPAGRPVSGPATTDQITVESSVSDVDLVPFVSLFSAIGALGLLAWRTRRPAGNTTRSADLP